MRFNNMTNEKGITEAMVVAHRLLTGDSKMHMDIQRKQDWHYDNIFNGVDVSFDLATYAKMTSIYTYRPLNPFTRSIAMTKGDGAIHFNIYKIQKTTIAEKVGTILHEYAHLCGFTHGNNFKTQEKCLYSVPYYLSENVSRWI